MKSSSVSLPAYPPNVILALWAQSDRCTSPSSSRILPTASPSAIVQFTGLLSVMVKVSEGTSTSRSPLTATTICVLLTPAGMLSVPEAAV